VRIGLLIYGRLDQKSGGYLYDRTLVDYLRKHGHTVQVISLPWHSYLANIGDNFSNKLFEKLRRARLDILLEDELNHPSLFLLNEKLRRAGDYPIISIVHHLRSSEQHPALLRAVYRAIERRYLRSMDGFVFNSRTTKGVVQHMVGSRQPYVVARPAGDRLHPRISAAQIAKRARQGEKLRVLFVGSLIRRKAPHVLLEALRQLPLGIVSVTLAGDAPDAAYARQLRKLAAGLDVKFAGHLRDAQLAAAMRTSQVLALPSSYEGYGIAYLEGMGFGLPAIGTRAGAADELITHGENGFLIQPGDSAALASYLRRLQGDRNLLLRMSKAVRQRYEKHPTWQESMARIADFLSAYNENHLSSSRRQHG
jgi:glycosyltransferase involved in cell wall biosynthesis